MIHGKQTKPSKSTYSSYGLSEILEAASDRVQKSEG